MREVQIKENDVLLFLNGRMAQVNSLDPFENDGKTAELQFLDSDEQVYSELNMNSILSNLGQSAEVLATFAATRSIHVRLNRISKV